MTIKNLTKEYIKIENLLSKKYCIENNQTRIFAKTVKVMEELGELCQEIISSQKLSRKEKNCNYKKENLEAEFCDVISTLFLLGIELDIDIEQALMKKIKETKLRLK